jgi:hypothetical protein
MLKVAKTKRVKIMAVMMQPILICPSGMLKRAALAVIGANSCVLLSENSLINVH